VLQEDGPEGVRVNLVDNGLGHEVVNVSSCDMVMIGEDVP
jgi:hypothetical protein